ncbi:SPW repeat domain-containing protein [Chondromyces apiculatus]|uniref:SPW repeat-containing integral membrane domain-containing protein n=1 Tax=Chondromyces apiculatus DSM 436 TaxID=1192034 RepID=A0A017TDS8_9BACT|nr:SPW repeat protein [Chondromyces apiculatus]EYF07453.1 Hypothetical protein CAP_0206 [Chondromyces apiculatus DSM 436]
MTVARGVNIALGLWLFASAFLWQHTEAQFTNAWVIGVLSTTFAVLVLWAPSARHLNTALGVWTVLSAWVLPSISTMTVWNNVIVGIGIFATSLLPAVDMQTTPTNASRG